MEIDKSSCHEMTGPTDPTAPIRAYYDQNTRFFERFGGSSKTHSVHRAVWSPGTATLEQALNRSNHFVLEAFQARQDRGDARPFVFADLGCGVGGTLIFLLKHLHPPVAGIGLTISPVQAGLARLHLDRQCPGSHAMIVEGDFLSLPLQPGFDALVSIEAFVHAPEPARYFFETARVLRPGGCLVLVDDFLPGSDAPARPDQRRWLQAFRSGWRVPGLSPLAQLSGWAASAGLDLMEDRDLTPWLRLRTLPAPLTDLILALGARIRVRHAILSSMLGSLALQHCLKDGLVEYRLLVFEKRAA